VILLLVRNPKPLQKIYSSEERPRPRKEVRSTNLKVKRERILIAN
jgi:hypothetical protein